MASRKRVAIVGAGPSGIVALKTVKQYGHDVTCFEIESSFGGMWRMTEDMKKIGYEPNQDEKYGGSAIYKSLLMNSSVYYSAFSDHPGEKTDINDAYWKPEDYIKYLDGYIDHFKLREHFEFDTTVSDIEKVGREWKLHLKPEREAVFDNVIIVTGPYRHGSMPQYPNQDKFQGTVIHSGQIKNDEILFKDKTVIIVGPGNSGQETTSCALSGNAKKVYMTDAHDKRNHFIGNRYCPCPDLDGKEIPTDCCVNRNNYFDHPEKLPEFVKTAWPVSSKPVAPGYIAQPPKDGLTITKANLLRQKEQDGILQKVPDICQFTADGVQLIDGTTLDDIDMVVFSTGFKARYPVLDGIWSLEEQRVCELYKHMVPVPSKLDGVTLIATACANTSALFPIMEMQARYICEKLLTREYNNEGQLYTQEERNAMLKDIEELKQVHKKLQRKYNYFIDGPVYIKKLAEEIGCDPFSPKQLFCDAKTRKDVELAVALQYGPLIGPQYRLRGPYSWSGAADHLIKVAKEILGKHFEERVEEHFNNK